MATKRTLKEFVRVRVPVPPEVARAIEKIDEMRNVKSIGAFSDTSAGGHLWLIYEPGSKRALRAVLDVTAPPNLPVKGAGGRWVTAKKTPKKKRRT